MTRNVGSIDALLRIAAGTILLAYALTPVFPDLAVHLPGANALGGWAWLGWIGAVPIATGIFGTCPAYSILGITTCDAV
ncbi:MAG: DUF2892 domain-containing protein [Magnetospirillum sp.]|nr:DUF2892 domain-containing protein [Magnetospirillum sp.]